MARGFQLKIKEAETSVAKTKFTAQLICAFVVTYAKSRFAYDAAHFYFLHLVLIRLDIRPQMCHMTDHFRFYAEPLILLPLVQFSHQKIELLLMVHLLPFVAVSFVF